MCLCRFVFLCLWLCQVWVSQVCSNYPCPDLHPNAESPSALTDGPTSNRVGRRGYYTLCYLVGWLVVGWLVSSWLVGWWQKGNVSSAGLAARLHIRRRPTQDTRSTKGLPLIPIETDYHSSSSSPSSSSSSSPSSSCSWSSICCCMKNLYDCKGDVRQWCRNLRLKMMVKWQ